MNIEALNKNFLLTQPSKNFFKREFINTFVMQVMEASLTAIFAAHIDFCLIND